MVSNIDDEKSGENGKGSASESVCYVFIHNKYCLKNKVAVWG